MTTVSVPAASDMTDATFALHIGLRHSYLRRAFRATRTEHEASHRRSPSGWFDHEHREPARAEPEPIAYTAPGRLARL